MTNTVNGLLDFISTSPTAFHVVSNAADMLSENGYVKLSEHEEWHIERGGKYFVTRNGSSIIAFSIPREDTSLKFMICASHSDSPTFKFKDNFENEAFGKYVCAATERYGGMIMSTWLDRPLSIAGRVVYSENDSIKSALVNIDKDLMIIPSVAIHMNRSVNDGFKMNAASDTIPLIGDIASKGYIKHAASDILGIDETCILSADYFLYCRGRGTLTGADGEFISSPRLDDLQCAYSSLVAMAESENSKAINVCAIFDNEETGSESKQGAASTFLYDTLLRVSHALGEDGDSFRAALASSFMISADNAHAMHPNHPEFSDRSNAPHMNDGIVIKFNASQKYTTDAVSAAIVKTLCARANVPFQVYANRSDLPGGSTLGSISNTKVSLCTADIGLAQLAMHSAYETAGTYDTEYMIRFLGKLFTSSITPECDGYRIG